MKLRVIGPYGGEAPGAFLNCFLLDETLLLDAGSVCQVLYQREQSKIGHVLLSHAHLDHFSSLPHMAVSVLGMDTDPVVIHASKDCLAVLASHVFNNEVWPDFTKIKRPNGKYVFELRELDEGRPNLVGGFTVQPVRVNHTVPTSGFIVERGGASIAYSADTGATEDFWRAVDEAPNLRLLIVEVSFPNAMRKLAELTGHLTADALALELRKIRRRPDFPVAVFGLKPEYEREIRAELAGLGIEGLEFPATNRVYEL